MCIIMASHHRLRLDYDGKSEAGVSRVWTEKGGVEREGKNNREMEKQRASKRERDVKYQRHGYGRKREI